MTYLRFICKSIRSLFYQYFLIIRSMCVRKCRNYWWFLPTCHWLRLISDIHGIYWEYQQCQHSCYKVPWTILFIKICICFSVHFVMCLCWGKQCLCLIFSIPYIPSREHQIFKIIVYIPHNYLYTGQQANVFLLRCV